MSFDRKSLSVSLLLGIVVAGTVLLLGALYKPAPVSLASIEPAAGEDVAGAEIGGPFALTDQDGRAVTDKDYAGDYKLVYFGFTNCPDVCPVDMGKITAALKILGKDADRLKPIFITVDPQRDTPEVIKSYLKNFDPRFTGLTGTKEQIDAVKKSYKIYAEEGEHMQGAGHDHMDSYMVSHSAYTYLMSPDGHLAALFGSEDTPEVIAARLAEILGKK